MVVVVLGLHRAEWARWVGDLDRVAVQHGAVTVLEPGPQLVERQPQRVSRVPSSGAGEAGLGSACDTAGEVLETRPAHRVTGEVPDALAEALEALRVEGVAVTVVDGFAGRPLRDEHEPGGELAVGEGGFVGLGDEGAAVRHQ